MTTKFTVRRTLTKESMLDAKMFAQREAYKSLLKNLKYIASFSTPKVPNAHIENASLSLAKSYSKFKTNIRTCQVEYNIGYVCRKLVEPIDKEAEDVKFKPKQFTSKFIYDLTAPLHRRHAKKAPGLLTKQLDVARKDIRKQIQACRKDMQANSQYFPKLYNGSEDFHNDKAGRAHKIVRYDGIHLETGGWEAIYQAKLAVKIYEPKVPKTTENHVGIELEFFAKDDAQALAAKFHKAQLVKYLHLHTDGSIRPEGNTFGHELSILVPEKDVYDVIMKVCKVLKEGGAKVNKSCGLHVHVDMRTRNKETTFNNLVCAQSILQAMQPKERQSNNFCRTVTTRVLAEQPVEGHEAHYQGINGRDALKKHGTFEVRLHTGTVDAVKICNWVKLLLLITNRTDMVKYSTTTFHTFVKQYDVPVELAGYIATRIKKHSESTEEEKDEVA